MKIILIIFIVLPFGWSDPPTNSQNIILLKKIEGDDFSFSENFDNVLSCQVRKASEDFTKGCKVEVNGNNVNCQGFKAIAKESSCTVQIALLQEKGNFTKR